MAFGQPDLDDLGAWIELVSMSEFGDDQTSFAINCEPHPPPFGGKAIFVYSYCSHWYLFLLDC